MFPMNMVMVAVVFVVIVLIVLGVRNATSSRNLPTQVPKSEPAKKPIVWSPTPATSLKPSSPSTVQQPAAPLKPASPTVETVTAPVTAPVAETSDTDSTMQPLSRAVPAARRLGSRNSALAAATSKLSQPRILSDTSSRKAHNVRSGPNAGASGKNMSLFSRQPDELDRRDVDVATRGFPAVIPESDSMGAHDNMMRKYSFENFREAVSRGSPKSILSGDDEDITSTERMWRSTGHTRAAFERHVQPLARHLRATGAKTDDSSPLNEPLAAALSH